VAPFSGCCGGHGKDKIRPLSRFDPRAGAWSRWLMPVEVVDDIVAAALRG